jgi:uncharacterized protein (TIGR00255 family)
MARSMTAFARLEASTAGGRAVWELRSVNHRFLEVSLRLPEEFRGLDHEIRNRLSARLNRGKLDCTLRFEAAARDQSALKVNTELARQIVNAAATVAALLPQPASINPLDVLRWPQVLEAPQADFDLVSKSVLEALDKALGQLLENRDREGEKLKALVLDRCTDMSAITKIMRTRVPEILAALRARQVARITELAGTLDPARVEQECALLIQRLDVAEELDRLGAHIVECHRVISAGGAAGKRLDFLAQEMNREANTIGSKSLALEQTRAAMDLKLLIEQLREQVQNLE